MNAIFIDLSQKLTLSNATSIRGALTVGLLIVTPFSILCPALQIIGIPALPPFEWSWPSPNPTIGRALGVIDVTLLSPAIESALLFIPVFLTKKITRNQVAGSIICAVFWGVIHLSKTDGVLVGLLSSWAFYCMTYIAWQSNRSNQTRAWGYITIIHIFINSTMLMITFLYHGVGNWS